MDPGQGDLIQNHEQGLVGYRFFCKQQHSRDVPVFRFRHEPPGQFR